jgi:hypothetical protein
MWKAACYATGGLFVAVASLCVVSASVARIEEAGDLDLLVRNAVVTGGMFALAIILLCAPRMPGAARWRYVLLAAVAVLIWALVSCPLISSHQEQVRFKSHLQGKAGSAGVTDD